MLNVIAIDAAALSPMAILFAGGMLGLLLALLIQAGYLLAITPRPASADEQQSARQLSGLITIAADAIISVDQAHSITLFNHGAEQIFGHSRDDIVGKPMEILLPERFRDRHAHHMHAFASSDSAARRMGERQEIVALHRDGHEFRAEASIAKLEIDGRWTFTVVMRDISDRIERESALKRSEERLNLALQAGRIGLFEHDHRADTLFWSPIYRELLGFGADEPASLARYMDMIRDDERDAVRSAMDRALDPAGDGRLTVEHRIIGADGQTRWLAVQSQTSFGGESSERRAVRTVGAVRDVTERREAEEELEARVEQRTRELHAETVRRTEAQAALSRAQRMEAFGQLAGGIAHDFNNLLTVITGNQELLEMRITDPKDLSLLKRSQEAAEMGARLTGRLLMFARRRQLEPTLLDINDAVTGMADLLRRTLGEHIDFQTDLDPSAWAVRADASEIENAVLNLAINARDAMPDGGRLVVETANVTLEAQDITADLKLPPGDYLRLSVSDTGTGMSPEVLQKAFEPFFTTKAPGKGTGLGLSTIYGFVQQSGGTVTIYSEQGVGTTVNVYLPRADEPGLAPESRDIHESLPRSGGELVLLVEDNPQVREVTRERLQLLGYSIIEAESGPAAIEVLKSEPKIKLVFSDVVMAGGMSGFDVVRWIRQHAPATKVLLASGFPGDVLGDDKAQGLDVKLLRKPYSRSELARSVRRAMDE